MGATVQLLKKLRFIAILLPLAADGAIFDDLEDLQGMTVLYAGEFERLTCPISSKYDCLTWPNNLFKTRRGREVCFSTLNYSCSYNCKGLIAAGSDNKPYAFFIENIGGDMKRASLETYKCPSMF